MKVWVLQSSFMYGDSDSNFLGVFASLELAQKYVAEYARRNEHVVFDGAWSNHDDWAGRDWHNDDGHHVQMFFSAHLHDVIDDFQLIPPNYYRKDRVS